MWEIEMPEVHHVWRHIRHLEVKNRFAGKYITCDVISGIWRWEVDLPESTPRVTSYPAFGGEKSICRKVHHVWRHIRHLEVRNRTAGKYTKCDVIFGIWWWEVDLPESTLCVTSYPAFGGEKSICRKVHYVWRHIRHLVVKSRTAGKYTTCDVIFGIWRWQV